MNESHASTLRLMKPGVWYCSSDYAGCKVMPDRDNHNCGRSIATLVAQGFIESIPVFEGFVTTKHRITSDGIAWLAAR